MVRPTAFAARLRPQYFATVEERREMKGCIGGKWGTMKDLESNVPCEHIVNLSCACVLARAWN